MDVLYTIGQHSGHDNMELRWSLRSLAKYAKNLGRIIVAGYPPFWLSDNIVRFPIPKLDIDHYKHSHILRQVVLAIKHGIVKGDFLLSSDDHFLTKLTDLEKTPFYKKNDHISQDFRAMGWGGEEYRKSVCATGALLRKHGYSDIQGNLHKNVRLNAGVVDEVMCLVNSERDRESAQYGFDTTILFQNVYAKKVPIEFQNEKDWKIDRYSQEAIDSGAFSISDNAFLDKKFLEYMDAEFGKPCAFEKYF